MAARIFPVAKKQILEIWSYTENTWGEDQADKYVRELVAAINSVEANRHLWRPVLDEDLPSFFFFHHQHHYVFFRELSIGSLGVIILHENMDIPSRLREDFERSE